MILFALALMAAPDRPLPPRVRRFIERRQGCDHWRGEYSPDPARRRQIERGVASECTGIDRELVRLRQLYRRTPSVLHALDDYGKVELK